MADDRLRLVAEVSDQFTGPLGKLETALRRAGATGTQAGKDLKKDFDGFHGSLGKATTALQNMAPVLSALGVGGLAAGVSLGAVTAALSGFSKGTQQLAIMSKETGLAVDQLRSFGALGERFGVSAETMQGGVKRFSDEMSRLRKRYGEAYSSLQAMNLGELVEKLVAAPNMKVALDAAMEALSNIGDPVKRRKVAEQLFGADQIGAVAGQVTGRYREMMDDIERRQGQTTDAQIKAAQKFEATLSSLKENLDGLRTQALGPLLTQLDELIKRFNSPEALKAFQDQLEEIGKFARTTVQEFEAIVRTYEKFKEFIGLGDPSKNKEFQPLLGNPTGAKALEGRKFSLEQQRDLLDKNPGAPDYQRKRDRMTEELKRVGDELEKLRSGGGATAQPSSYGGVVGGGGGLIHKAAFGGFGGGGGSPGLGGFGGPLPTMGGGYGGGNPNVTGGGAGRGYGSVETAISPSAPVPNAGAINSTALPPAGSGRARGVTSAQGRENVGSWLEFLQRGKDQGGMGLSADKSRAMVAMLQGESGRNLNPGAYNPNDVNGPSGGTAQWHDKFGQRGRLTALREFAAAQGKSWNDRGVQQQFFKHEMETTHARARRAIEAAPDGPSALYAGIDKFESPADKPGEFQKRMQNYRALDGVAASGSSGDAPSAPSGGRMGDNVMRRFYGDEAPTMKGGGKGSLDITLHGFPAGTKPRASMDDLFKDVNVSKSRQMETTSI